MSILVSQISLPPDRPEREALALALRRLGLSEGQATAAVYKKSVDARRRGRAVLVYTVLVSVRGDEQALLQRLVDQKNIRLSQPERMPPLFGESGFFRKGGGRGLRPGRDVCSFDAGKARAAPDCH